MVAGRAGTGFNVDKYYFYLAFENTLCQDYVTEKVINFHPIKKGGGAYMLRLKRVFAKNERGYRLTAKNKRF